MQFIFSLLVFGLILRPAAEMPAFGFEAIDPGGAKAALAALPEKYRHGVLKISADSGNPNPPAWYIIAKNADAGDANYSVTVTGGAVTAEKPSLDLRELLGHPTVIDLGAVALDSTQAFEEASTKSTAAGHTLGTVSYVLQQQGGDAAPVWSIWCYGPDGSYFGEMKILATTGAVIATDGF